MGQLGYSYACGSSAVYHTMRCTSRPIYCVIDGRTRPDVYPRTAIHRAMDGALCTAPYGAQQRIRALFLPSGGIGFFYLDINLLLWLYVSPYYFTTYHNICLFDPLIFSEFLLTAYGRILSLLFYFCFFDLESNLVFVILCWVSRNHFHCLLIKIVCDDSSPSPSRKKKKKNRGYREEEDSR